MSGTYAHPTAKGQKAKPHEYLNTRTGQYEVVKSYGVYSVRETFLTPNGTILLLAHNEHNGHPWAIGEHNGIKNGVFWRDGADARRNFAWLIAESFGLTVDKEGSKAVVPASRQYATELCQKVKEHAGKVSSGELDEFEMEQAAEALAGDAVSLAKHLQRIGVLSETVYERWEAVG